MSEQRLSRRDFLKAASTALAASGFAALPVGMVRAQDDDVNLVLWGFASNRVEWMENVVDEIWADMHPNVSFTFEVTPYWDLWPKLTAVFVGGTGIPDMVDIEINQTGQYVREPGAEPFAAMNDLLGEDLDSLSIPSATAPWTVRGNIYGVGNEVNPLLMLYRVDVMEELGVDAEAPVSWDEWIELVGGPVLDSGTALTRFERGAGSWRELNNVLNAAGGQFFDGDGNVTVLDNDPGCRHLDLAEGERRFRHVPGIRRRLLGADGRRGRSHAIRRALAARLYEAEHPRHGRSVADAPHAEMECGKPQDLPPMAARAWASPPPPKTSRSLMSSSASAISPLRVRCWRSAA